ncbi:MAG: RES family NAD+ phosphorylase [Cyclobacteriaceae bacterium]|jgi:RES domain-containing protein|nr:RES family NAD+ phosphorylase [Cyclobacteriaceae bacterium]
MICYRISLTKYAVTSGMGAKLVGGRWNLPGTPALYACHTISAALLERLTIDSELFASDRYVLYSIMEFKFDDRHIHVYQEKQLPEGWNSIPFQHTSQVFGNVILQSGKLAFAVPSVVDPSSLNIILNPISELFERVDYKVYPLTLDKRIVR